MQPYRTSRIGAQSGVLQEHDDVRKQYDKAFSISVDTPKDGLLYHERSALGPSFDERMELAQAALDGIEELKTGGKWATYATLSGSIPTGVGQVVAAGFALKSVYHIVVGALRISIFGSGLLLDQRERRHITRLLHDLQMMARTLDTTGLKELAQVITWAVDVLDTNGLRNSDTCRELDQMRASIELQIVVNESARPDFDRPHGFNERNGGRHTDNPNDYRDGNRPSADDRGSPNDDGGTMHA